MSLNPDKSVSATGSRRPRSITVRLATYYAASAFIMLVAVMAYVYVMLSDGIEEDEIHLLADKTARLEWILLHHADHPALLDYEITRDAVEPENRLGFIYFARILDDAGQPIAESPGMAKAVQGINFPYPVAIAQFPDLKVVQHWRSPQGRTFAMVSAHAGNGQNGQSWTIQVAMDDSDDNAQIAKLRQTSLTILLLGTLISAAIGGAVARRGMRPLQQIAVTAERITANQLNERLNPAHWPAELDAVAHALNRMFGRLEESFARMSQCAEDLAHELRTPIHNLMGEAEVALLDELRPDDYRHVLESSLEELDRLTRMINEILFLARVENPRKLIERVSLDVRKELEAVTEFFDALSEAQGVTVTSEGEGEMYADPLLFRRAVTNLLSNSLRHTPGGGRIVLSVAQDETGATLVKVADSGCGIPPEDLPGICERVSCTRRIGGQCSGQSGLGLPIVKSIVELHGGSITVDSVFGVGTTILLRFPAGKQISE